MICRYKCVCRLGIAVLVLCSNAGRILAQQALEFANQTLACDGNNLPSGPYSGADGPYAMTTQKFPNPIYTDQNVVVFQPTGATRKRPVIFFSHGYGPNLWQAYSSLISHLVSLGYIVVYSPYPPTGVDNDARYDILWSGFAAAVTQAGDMMDLTRVGFLGHSFGGGATPAMVLHGMVEQGWGSQGAFMMLLAPWYSYQADNDQLLRLPKNLLQAFQIYDQDVINDPRMAIDVYRQTPLGAGKYFLIGNSGTIGGCTLTADHSTPGTNASLLLKRLVVFRPLDALASLAFDHAESARIALLLMGALLQPQASYQPLNAVSGPIPDAAQSAYQFPWANSMNPRQATEVY